MLTNQQIEEIVNELKRDPRVQGILLTGSYIYGKPNAESDLDVRCITNDSSDWAEFKRMRFGVPVEVFLNTPHKVRSYMQQSKEQGHGDCIHFWAFGKKVYDPFGVVDLLIEEAKLLWKKGPAEGKKWIWRWEKHQKYIDKF